MPTKIPVFVSAPTKLNKLQHTSYRRIIHLLDRENLERRALGRSDYPTEYPLKEVHMIARHCAGGIILGYSQSVAKQLEVKPGTRERTVEKNVKFPTPWNHLEAGILFSLRLPLMVFREDGISGGVFDNGVTDVFINRLPIGRISKHEEEQILFSIQIWVGRVRERYRRWE
jgi:hypothetical protein